MKIHCICGAKYDVDQELIGRTIICDNCSRDIIIKKPNIKQMINMFNCPDCDYLISRKATICVHCGCPISEKKNPKPIVTVNNKSKMYKITSCISYGLFAAFGVSFISFLITMNILFFNYAITVLFFCVIALILRQITNKQPIPQMICRNTNCNYIGDVKQDSQNSIAVFCILLLFGIIPGFLYWGFKNVKNSMYCPVCGVKVR